MVCNSHNFTGQISAGGGSGVFPGGAGTIFTSLAGTNTPLEISFSLPAPPFALNISGAAVVVPTSPLPLVNNLNLAAGSTLTVPSVQANLVIAVRQNANLAGTPTLFFRLGAAH